MSSRLTFYASTAIVSIALAGVAIAQSGPFDSPPPAGTKPTARPYVAPAPAAQPYNAPSYSAPSYAQPAPSATAQSYSAPAPAPMQNYQAPAAPQTAPYAAPSSGGAYYPPADPAPYSAQSGGAINYGGQAAPGASPQFSRGAAYTDPNYRPGSYAPNTGAPNNGYANTASSEPMSGGPYGGAQNYPQSRPQARPQSQPQKRGFWNKLRLKTDGFLRIGDAYVTAENPDGSDNDRNELVVDGMVRGEVSTLTNSGLEYGVSLKLRGQRDRLREGFGGLAGDCPPGFADCANIVLAGTPRAVKGHTGQLYNFGDAQRAEQKFAVEGAHLFLRSPYGDVTLGRDDGSAALFSSAAPSTLPLARAANARTNYTGLDMTKTLNDASGFAEKITYTSPRLLGDQIGFGVQFGVSYAPKTEVCGVDYCVEGNDTNNALSPLTPEMEDAVEFGMAIDRTFGSGLSVEGTLNYAAASESTGFAAFDDLQSWGTGLNIGWGDFEFGTNYLLSNNGIADNGDYSAFDAGLTWKPAKWGVTLGYGQSEDELAKIEGRSVVLGGSYDWSDAFTLGTGIQYSERDVPVQNGILVGERTDDALAIFVEGGFEF